MCFLLNVYLYEWSVPETFKVPNKASWTDPLNAMNAMMHTSAVESFYHEDSSRKSEKGTGSLTFVGSLMHRKTLLPKSSS